MNKLSEHDKKVSSEEVRRIIDSYPELSKRLHALYLEVEASIAEDIEVEVAKIISNALSERDKVIVEMLEEEQKTVKDLFPDAIHEPTVKYSLQVEAKNYYNKALRDMISLITRKDKDEE